MLLPLKIFLREILEKKLELSFSKIFLIKEGIFELQGVVALATSVVKKPAKDRNSQVVNQAILFFIIAAMRFVSCNFLGEKFSRIFRSEENFLA